MLTMWWSPLLLNSEYVVEPSAAQCSQCGGALGYSIADYVLDPIAAEYLVDPHLLSAECVKEPSAAQC